MLIGRAILIGIIIGTGMAALVVEARTKGWHSVTFVAAVGLVACGVEMILGIL